MECIFCNIVKGKLPADFVFENDDVVAFHDIHPKAPAHILIVPREHVVSINDLKEEHSRLVTALMLAAPLVAKKLGVKKTGYKLMFNVGRGGGQVVDHIHMHLLAWGDKTDEMKAKEREKEVALV